MAVRADHLISITRKLAVDCDDLRFAPPVDYIYNPLDYAWTPHEQYLRRFEGRSPDAVLVGMNPGPFGMLQTGVPFGEVQLVRDWLGIEAPVDQPPRLHPKRPVQGFACPRREVSGKRIWGWAQERYGDADSFLDRFFVLNYCPLAFFEASGTNRTPDKLRREEREALFGACDRALAAMLDVIRPRWVIGVGRFAEERAVVAAEGREVAAAGVIHPSPANPAANKGWAPHMDALVARLEIS